jgi:hypothetical protein
VLVTFRKEKRGVCMWTAFPAKRRPVGAVGGGGFGTLPHDLAQFVVERELGHRHGFWGCLADGATFRTVARSSRGRRRTPQGKAVIAAHVAELDAAEHDAHVHVAAWLGGRPTPVATALDELRTAWLALPEHGELTLEFPTDVRRTKATSYR